MMDFIQVNEETCTRCGTCVATCPGGFISFQSKEYPQPGPLAESLCSRCGHCVAVCPTGSLTHREMPVEYCPPIQAGLRITAEQCEQFLRGRRSIRRYRDQPVPREVITRLIEISRYAPTGHNFQNVEWLAIDKREELDRIEDLALEWMRWAVSHQSRYLSGMGLTGMLEHAEKSKKKANFLRGAPVLVVAHAAHSNPIAFADCSIALTFLDLAAQNLGLGSCWAGLVYFMANEFQPMQKELALPEGHTAFGCMMLGYPEFRYHRLPVRKAPRITWR